MATTSCPVCGSNSQVQKVTAVVASGTVSGYHGSGTTSLARSLAMPSRTVGFDPEFGGSPGVGGCMLVLALIGLAVLGSLTLGSLESPLIWVVAGVLVVLYLVWAIRQADKNSTASARCRADEATVRQMYERMYYCFRDDVVFDSSNATNNAPLSKFDSLFRGP